MEDNIMKLLQGSLVIPSVSNMEHLKFVVEKTTFSCVMVKMGDLNNIGTIVHYIHKAEKKVLLHIDSIKGISKDKAGFHYLKRIGVDAVITMKSQNIRMIKEEGMVAILGTFLVDSASINLTIQNIHSNKPDAIVAMPMTIPDEVYEKIKTSSRIPILAGGLGVNGEIVDRVLKHGVCACAVTDRKVYLPYERRER